MCIYIYIYIYIHMVHALGVDHFQNIFSNNIYRYVCTKIIHIFTYTYIYRFVKTFIFRKQFFPTWQKGTHSKTSAAKSDLLCSVDFWVYSVPSNGLWNVDAVTSIDFTVRDQKRLCVTDLLKHYNIGPNVLFFFFGGIYTYIYIYH